MGQDKFALAAFARREIAYHGSTVKRLAKSVPTTYAEVARPTPTVKVESFASQAFAAPPTAAQPTTATQGWFAKPTVVASASPKPTVEPDRSAPTDFVVKATATSTQTAQQDNNASTRNAQAAPTTKTAPATNFVSTACAK